MLIYDIPTDTWTESTATLSSPRSDLCMAAVGGVLYAAGAAHFQAHNRSTAWIF